MGFEATTNPIQAAVRATVPRVPQISTLGLRLKPPSANVCWTGVIVTLLCHAVVVAVNLTLLAASEDRGLSSLQISALHCAVLLGMMRPHVALLRWRLWWEPAADTYGALLLFGIGIVHFLGVGIIEYVPFHGPSMNLAFH